jgi:L-alanine-DL-glutamate epimerase-like enolase superfamily enzyme
LRKVAHAAEGFGLDVAIHAPGPAHRHCFAALRNCNWYEMGLVHPKLKTTKAPIFKNGYTDDLNSIDANGNVDVPQAPGLGVEIDWGWVRQHQVGVVVYE